LAKSRQWRRREALMKIAVYAIAKNEAQHVERFMAAVREEADLVLVADTGSTDRTVELLHNAGATVSEIKIDPWRFDVARNTVMDLLPEDVDICVALDLDDVPQKGWRLAIEKAWGPQIGLVRYLYTYRLTDGSRGRTFWHLKIHARHGYRWCYPVHELLKPADAPRSWSACDEDQPDAPSDCEMVVDHWRDLSKSRDGYLPLLELAVRENPESTYCWWHLGQEYMKQNVWGKAIASLTTYLSLPVKTSHIERSAVMRWIAQALHLTEQPGEAIRWLLRACAEGPDQREPWIELAGLYRTLGGTIGAYYAATSALAIQERPQHNLTEPYAWDDRAEKLASDCQAELTRDLKRNRRVAFRVQVIDQ
jgi:hypothetical protein